MDYYPASMMESYVGNFDIVSLINEFPGNSPQRIRSHELEIFVISKTTASCLPSDTRSGTVAPLRKYSAIS